MKISELMAELEAIKEDEGDLDVYLNCDQIDLLRIVQKIKAVSEDDNDKDELVVMLI